MYFWGSDSLDYVSGAVLIPTRFVWPHGGTRVFVSGTFTRPTCQQCNAHYWWSEPVPMFPVEGFPNVFQAICDVGRGLHQYKFYVDDEWRHDEQQPHVKGNHGIVNTLLLTRNTNPVPPILSPGTPESRINMDADNDVFQRVLGDHGSNLTQEELDTYTISAWKEGKQFLHGQVNGHGRPVEKQLVHAGACDSLKDVAIKILRNSVATVPIIHSVSDDGFPRLLHVASLSGILRCICRHFRHSYSFVPILHQPICMIPLGTWIHSVGETNGRPLAMLRPNATLGSALALLVQARVSSIPIVNEYDALLDIYCRSDITALAKDRTYAKIHPDEMSILKAIQLRQDATSPYGSFDGQGCQICFRTDPLQKVIEKLAKPGVRRLIIVEAGSKRVEGIISLSDVFRFLLGWPSLLNSMLNS